MSSFLKKVNLSNRDSLGAEENVMHKNPELFCIFAQLKDLYLMITGKEDGCKEFIVH